MSDTERSTPPQSRDQQALPERIGRFRLTGRLGEGGMGLVYAAVDPALERPVAIKVIRRDLVEDAVARERFWREARIVASITDPGICQVYEAGDADGRLFIAMELLEGEPLNARLERGAAPFAEAIPILLQVLSALDALHRRGIVHRDLKPSNIFLTPRGIKLLDFGLARSAQVEAMGETGAQLTRTGMIVGTPRYMAPEQLLGQSIDERTDLFAAGAIFYELLAGRAAFSGDSLVDIMQRVLMHEPPSLGGSPAIEAADRIIQRALARSPEARYPSAAEMIDAARTLLVHSAAGAGPSAPAVRASARSIAVLPFIAVGADPDSEEFADGMTEDVIAQLAKIRSVRVIARGSVMPFRKREQPLPEIADRLGVRTLLDGSVRHAGSRVRIVAQLVDAGTSTPLWSETYDRDRSDVFSVQSDVAMQIVHALEAELSLDERARLQRRPTTNRAAHQLYLKGRHCLLRYTAEGVRQGLGFFEQATAEDPGFALGHAWIALAHLIHSFGYGAGARPDAAHRAAREAALRALALDPELGDAHGALAFVKLVADFDWAGSEAGFRRGLELNPGSDLMWSAYGLLLLALERHDEALAAYRRAKELDPLTAVHASTLATTLLRAGRTDEAVEEAARLVELQPDFPMAWSTLGLARVLKGAVDEGLENLERATKVAPGNTMLLGQLAHAYGITGRDAAAREILGRLLDTSRERYVSPYHLAYIYTGLREWDAAMDCLERAYEERAGGIYGVKGSFLFTGLASHPRFNALLNRLNLGGHDD